MARGEGTGEGTGEGKGSGFCPGILWSILWFFCIFIALFIAFFIAGWYILFLPFCACLPPCKGICDAFLKWMQLPLTCAENMVAMKSCC